MSEKERGVFAALIEDSTNTIATGETYQAIDGVFCNSPLASFVVVDDPGIQYTDAHKWFEIDWYATAYADKNGTTVHIGIKKNNQLIKTSIMGTFLKISDEAQALGGTCTVDLKSGDVIQLVITSDESDDVITLKHFTTKIREFF